MFSNSDSVNQVAEFIPVFEEIILRPEIGPIEVFRMFRSLGYSDVAFFQQSRMEGDSFTPSETVIAIDPFETIRISGNQALILNEEGDRTRVEANPFSLISQRMSTYRAGGSQFSEGDSPFFRGGALGYFSYDSVRTLEPTLKKFEGNLRNLDSESESKSKHYDAEFMFFRKAVIFDHLRHRVLVMSGYFADQKFKEVGLRRARSEVEELRAICHQITAGTNRPFSQADFALDSFETVEGIPAEKFESMLGKEQFLEGVRQLKHHIREGDIFQAVLSEKFKMPFQGDPLDLFQILSVINPAPYRFYLSCGGRVMMGASPEMLLKVTDNVLETHPIAGTRPRGLTAAEEKKMEKQLLKSEKEQAEHLMLVDLARNDIGRVSESGSVRVSAYRQLKKFGGVMHLVSQVTGTRSSDTQPIEALAACFPAGTLSGAPKIRAMQLLSGLEPEARGFYGGAVVMASFTGQLDSCIAIRSIQVENGVATIQAGAGVVADSLPEKEYREVLHKSSMMRKALAIATSSDELNAPISIVKYKEKAV